MNRLLNAVRRPRARMAGLPMMAARVAALAGALSLGGCAAYASLHKPAVAEPAPVVQKARPAVGADGQPLATVDGVAIERVQFRLGVSSSTVEKLARETAQCTTQVGAALVSEPGPVEIYRIACDNGQVFMARCELRQCQRYAR